MNTKTLVVVLSTFFLFGAAPTTQPRTSDAILADLAALKRPPVDEAKYKADEKAYEVEYTAQIHELQTRQYALAKELLDADPTNPKLPIYLEKRWISPEHAAEADAVIRTGQPAGLVSLAEFVQLERSYRSISRKTPDLTVTPDHFAPPRASMRPSIPRRSMPSALPPCRSLRSSKARSTSPR